MKTNIPAKIVVAANFTIESISGSLTALLGMVSQISDLVFAPYNQIFQQLLDRGSSFHRNTHGVNIIFLRLEDLIDSRSSGPESVREGFGKIKANAAELMKSLRSVERFKVPLFVFLCPASVAIQNDPDLAAGFEAVEQAFLEMASNISNLFVFGTGHIASRYRVVEIDNPKGNVLGHIPYTASFVSALAVEAVRKIDAYYRKPFKALVLDCDNTLWDGVIGEDGIEGIGFSDKRLFVQNLAVEQSKSGIVVCLNSKNNDHDVWEAFEKRDDMILKKEHVVSSRINWLPKSQNLKSIAEELRLGLDSFVFIDDDPAVCDEVQRHCPEVLTVLLPSGDDDFRNLFEHLWVFDKLAITQEDQDRTRSYQGEAHRREYRAQASDMAEFLKSLELVCDVSPPNDADISRVSQLTLRTNQFNSTTPRLTEADIFSCLSDGRRSIWTAKVRDRFGDYGLVGVVIFEELDESLVVESFMLSCRILGRGVEHQIVNHLGKKALAAGCKSVSFNFVPTERNAPMLNFLTQIGEAVTAVGGGKVIYRVPASVAVECTPHSSLEVEQPSHRVPVQTRTPQTEHGPNFRQIYVEIARLLSTGGASAFNGTVSELSRTKLKRELNAARTETEERLTQIWEQALNVTNIGTADNFFEIGGNSLIAVSLFVAIEEKFGRSLPITSLLSSPTIETLAKLIDFEPEHAAWKYLVPLQPQGTKPPLFCMHAAGGNVLFYRDLANALGDDQPVYGLQAKGVSDKSETAHDRIEDMAAEYLQEIRRHQPVGPYQLCGSSFGGLVAFEAAKQLRDSGESISLLAMFDTYAPGYLQRCAYQRTPSLLLLQLLERVRNTTSRFRELRTRGERIKFVFDRIDKLKARQKRKIAWKKNEFAIQYNKVTGRELPNDVSRNHKAIRKAEADYRPEPYDGRLLLIRASNQPRSTAFEPFLGWRPYVRTIFTEEVSGAHGAIAVYPFADGLAAKLGNYLDGGRILAEPKAIGRGEHALAQTSEVYSRTQCAG